MMRYRKGDDLRIASLIHRISGVVLAVFLPVHFYVLGMALTDAAQLDGFLKWTDLAIVKIAEAGLVLLLALHMFGGLRLLAIEFLPWSPQQKTFAAAAIAVSFFVSVSFFLSAV